MPDISTTCDISILLVIMCNLNTIKNSLCSSNLIWSHNHQHILRRKHTILCKNIQNSMLRKKCLRKVNEIRNHSVIGISPERCKFKAIACLFLLCLSRSSIFNRIKTCTVRIILCVGSVRDYKYLSILKQAASCPE